jgi:predicted outer membrane repeat protein
MRNFYILSVAFFTSLSILQGQQTYFVNLQATAGQQNGTSWPNAFIDLQAALSVADYGDEIWVASGVYYPTDTTDRSLSFELKNGVRLLGGFNATELSSDQRDPSSNITRLSANIGDLASKMDNSYHVLRGRGLDANTILDGFVISDGYSIAAEDAKSDASGAGLYLVGSSELTNSKPIISNCRFEYNEAGGTGGAIFASFQDLDDPSISENLLNPVLRNCTFDHNYARHYGGALYKEGQSGSNDSFLMEDCRFTSNYVFALDGGGIFFARANQSNIILKRCLFESNTSFGGQGAGFCLPLYGPGGYTTNFILDTCVFRKNVAPTAGGFSCDGLTLEQKDVILNLQIQGCLFEENDATNENGGAFLVTLGQNCIVNSNIQNSRFVKNRSDSFFATAFLCYDESESNVLVENCDFLGNEDFDNPSSYCAAFDAGGSNANTRINNCLFANNGSALFAGSYEQSQVLTQVTNCTFYLNGKEPFGKRWYQSYNLPGAVYYNKMNFYNCVIWETKVTNRLITNTNPNQLTGSWFFFDYCTLHPMNPAGVPNAQEVFGDSIFIGPFPDFVDTTAGDFRLKTCSPAMNRGLNQASLDAGLERDLDGNPRIRFTTVDIGAYETQDSCFTSSSQAPHIKPTSARISPSPGHSGSALTIQVAGFENPDMYWNLRDAYGRSMASGKTLLTAQENFTIDAPASSGIYFVEIRSGVQFIWLKFTVVH